MMDQEPTARRPARSRAPRTIAALALAAVAAVACADELPADVADYRETCILMTQSPIPPYPSDPHDGFKDVYACDVTEDQLVDDAGEPIYPYPVGTLIVKESVRERQGYVWLVATARKGANGAWTWKEYKRNFANEELRQIPAPESVCTDCHRDAIDRDWIFTSYSVAP